MPSPIKQPKEDKELKGTLRKSREKTEELHVEELKEIPMAPEDLPKAGQDTWYRVVGQLKEIGVLSSLDLDMLKIYCFHIATMAEAMEEMAKKGGKVTKAKAKSGEAYFIKSPWVGIYNDSASHAEKIAKEFGFTPLSRKNIPAPKKEKKGKLVALMGDKKK